MEHRWGERVPVQMTVELWCGSAQPVRGSLENVSSSGAFVRTEGCRPGRGPIEVTLAGRDAGGHLHAVRLPAYVVRESDTGVGIEWSEFAPRVIRELMRSGRGTATRARARALRPIRQSAQPSTEPAAIGSGVLPAPAAAKWR